MPRHVIEDEIKDLDTTGTAERALARADAAMRVANTARDKGNTLETDLETEKQARSSANENLSQYIQQEISGREAAVQSEAQTRAAVVAAEAKARADAIAAEAKAREDLNKYVTSEVERILKEMREQSYKYPKLYSKISPVVGTQGQVKFFMTADGTETGTALFSAIADVQPQVNDITTLYTFGWSISANLKVLTVNVRRSATPLLSLLGINILAAPSIAPAGTNVGVLVSGYLTPQP
jgi:hypothetical protein